MRNIAQGRLLLLLITLTVTGRASTAPAYGHQTTNSQQETPKRERIIEHLARQSYQEAASEARSLHSSLAATPATNPSDLSDALCLLGFAQFLAGDLANASAAYQRALETNPDASTQIGSYRLLASAEEDAIRSYHSSREWTDNTGKHTTAACYVSHTDENVTLSTSGTLRTVPLDRLSDADKKYLETLGDYARDRQTQKATILTPRLGKVERLSTPDPTATTVVQNCLEEMAQRKLLVYEYTNIEVVTTWLNGSIPIGKELVFTKGRSEVPLDQGCKYAMIYFSLVNRKRNSVQGIESQLSKVRSQISRLQAQQKQAQLQGVGFNTALLTNAQQTLANLATHHSVEIAAFTKMNSQLTNINKTMNTALSQYIESFSKASAAVASAPDASLTEILNILDAKSLERDGYGEAILFAQASLFSKERLQDARERITQHKQVLESSDGMGFSPLNLSRLVLSTLLGVDEDNSDVIRSITRNKDMMKHGLTCHALGTVYLAAGRHSSAESMLKRAYAKADDDARPLIAADVCYTVLARDTTKTVADVEKYVGDVKHPAGTIDWRVERAQAMIACAAGEHSAALQHAQKALALCPPKVEDELSRMVVAAGSGQRFAFSEEDVKGPDQPVGLD